MQLPHGKCVPNVAIVGAGISGLRCADILLRAGVQVTMFEARNRIGGRVHQTRTDGHLVDTGCNWIHGTQGNPISRLAKKTGTVVMEPQEGQIVFDSSGNAFSEEVSKGLGSEVWGTIIKAFKYSNEHFKDISVTASLFDYFKSDYELRFKGDDKKIKTLLDESRMFGPYVGEKVERQSLRFFYMEESLDGENVFVASTYQRVLDEVAKTALKEADIHFEEPVTSIKYREENELDDCSVQIETSKGKHQFDEVIVTCPLGWLKRNKSVFSPPLPIRLTQAIDNVGYGKLEKLYVTFPSAFWIGQDQQEEPKSLPCFIHFHSPTYHPITASHNSSSWNQSVVSLAHLPSPVSHPTLLFYFYGDCGTYLTKLLQHHEPHSPEYNKLLTSFAEPFYSKLPHFSSKSIDCHPTSFLLTSWQLDSYAGHGSYTNFPIGVEQGDKDIEVMRNVDGLSEAGRGLWLAGEHTAPFVALGTTTGAWWSGERVAQGIVKRYGIEVTNEELEGTINEATSIRRDL